jgi:hypothetical protein
MPRLLARNSLVRHFAGMTRAGEKLYHPNFVGSIPATRSGPRSRVGRWIAGAIVVWLVLVLHG